MNKKNSPLVVSFMGVDGSGKTTLARKLNKYFKGSMYLHLKPYILFKDRRTIVKDPHSENKSTTIFSLFRLFSWFMSYKIFFFVNKKKKIFIFDRYAHDVIIDPIRYKHNLPYNITNFLLNIFPKPDLWIYLKPSVKTLKSRKFELSEQELKSQIKKYSTFFRTKKNVLVLNTSNQYKILTNKILKKINYIIK